MRININCDDFLTYFKPVINCTNTAIVPEIENNLYGFATFGTDLAHVQAEFRKNPECVWTHLDVDGKSIISNGFHHVNRVSYLITSIPSPKGTMIDVFENPPAPQHRLACFANFNGVTNGVQAIMGAIGNETFESYSVWMSRMLNTWSAETRLSRANMRSKHYALFDTWLTAYVSEQSCDMLQAA